MRKSLSFSVLTTIIYAIVGGTIWNVLQDLLSKKLLTDWSKLSPAIILFCFATICSMLYHILQRLEELNEKTRLTIQFFSVDEYEEEKIYEEGRKIIEKTREDGKAKIIAVNSFVELFQDSEKQKDKTQRQSYFRALEKKIRYADYYRILQLEKKDMDIKIGDWVSLSYKEHFRKMAMRRDKDIKHRREIRLDAVPAKYPTTFIMIDNQEGGSYLIWQINEHVYSNDRVTKTVKMQGSFIITDPDQQIIKHFRAWFNKLQNSHELRPIKTEELEER
jgi:hypothetical protein